MIANVFSQLDWLDVREVDEHDAGSKEQSLPVKVNLGLKLVLSTFMMISLLWLDMILMIT